MLEVTIKVNSCRNCPFSSNAIIGYQCTATESKNKAIPKEDYDKSPLWCPLNNNDIKITKQ